MIERLLAEPQRFGFFQAVRLLERWLAQTAPGARITFRNSLSLSFPASEIETLRLRRRDDPGGAANVAGLVADAGPNVERIELTPAFMGMLGTSGALPTFYTEQLAWHENEHRDVAGRAFFDIFQQRAMTLMVRAWLKHRLQFQYEADRRNRFLPLVLSLAGLGQQALRDRLRAGDGGVADKSIAYYAGAFQRRVVASGTIRRLLAEHFGVPVRLDEFVGRWFRLAPSDRTRLGLQGASLGHGALVGERVWQRDLRVRLTLGPLARDAFRRFLPGGPGHLALQELLRMLTGSTLEYEVRLALRADQIRGSRLDAREAPRLGWDSFMVSAPPGAQSRDRDDAGYELMALP